MVYKWKIPGLYPVDANTAGEEINRIYNEKGRCDPSDVVESSRPSSAPLHSCFEWDDSVAAEKYRESQAGEIIRAVVTVVEETANQETKVETRAFVNVEHTYHPISVVVQDEDMYAELMRKAMNDMASFKKRYSQLSTLKPVIQEMDKLLEQDDVA